MVRSSPSTTDIKQFTRKSENPDSTNWGFFFNIAATILQASMTFMNKTILSCAAGAMLLFAACGPTKDDAIRYNDSLIAIETSLTPVYNAFIDQTDGHNVDSLKLTYEAFAAKAKASFGEVQNMQPFAEKREYLDAIVTYFKTINDLAQNEGRQLVDILSKDSAQVTEEDVANVGKFADKFNADYESALKAAQAAQTAFAREWKFEVH
jgi:hypothetical protein